ncbi:MAG TPA: hypothetical protein VFZ64_13795 [Nocardioidaceae bacterium]
MRDPFEELKNLNVAGPALPAHEVRRRGDRMRRRRTALQAVGAAAAVAVIASGGAMMTGSLTSTTPPAGPATPTPVETPSSSPAPEQTEPPEPSPTPAPEPEPTPGPTPEGGWRTAVPDGFPIARGLPEAGGDIPAWEWSVGPGTQLSAVACGEREKLPARPVDGLRVAVEPPDESAWRHLLLFEDAATAAEAHGRLLASAGNCPDVVQDRTSPDEIRWFLSQSARGRTPVIDVEGRVYAGGSDVRVPGRVLTRVVQVGNAVLVARLDSASSGIGRDAEARGLTSDVETLIGEMCVFAADGCGG